MSRLVGKTIAKVVRKAFPGSRDKHCDGIQFTDGTWMQFVTLEHPDGNYYGTTIIYPARDPQETESPR